MQPCPWRAPYSGSRCPAPCSRWLAPASRSATRCSRTNGRSTASNLWTVDGAANQDTDGGGTGPQARVELKLRDKPKLKGYISEAGAESFTVVGADAIVCAVGAHGLDQREVVAQLDDGGVVRGVMADQHARIGCDG